MDIEKRLGLATEWIEMIKSNGTQCTQTCLGLATEWIEMLILSPLNTSFRSLGLATEWIEIKIFVTSTQATLVSVLRPSGLK